jgi:catechol 2,3-dioxygenase-like lactoylglutathione lyase family enzyme
MPILPGTDRPQPIIMTPLGPGLEACYPPRAERPMIQIRAIDHVVLRVRRLEPMLAFYRDVLGCPVEKVQADLGLWQLRAGTALVDLVTVDGPLGREGGPAPGPDGHNLDHLCFRLETFDEVAIRAHLGRHGVDADRSANRYGADGEGPSMYLRDPEGNRVELKG